MKKHVRSATPHQKRRPRGRKGGLVQITPNAANTSRGDSGRGASGSERGWFASGQSRPERSAPAGGRLRQSASANTPPSSRANGRRAPQSRTTPLRGARAAIAPSLGQQHPATWRSANRIKLAGIRRSAAAADPPSQRAGLGFVEMKQGRRRYPPTAPSSACGSPEAPRAPTPTPAAANAPTTPPTRLKLPRLHAEPSLPAKPARRTSEARDGIR